jgi:hypothetical protein
MRFPLALTPVTHGQFAWFCTAATISGLGTWVQSTASAWVMTDLAPDALMVSLIQAAAGGGTIDTRALYQRFNTRGHAA